MKLRVVLLLTLSLLSVELSAQEILIDVPSAEVVAPKKILIQQQAAFTAKDINTSTTIIYGLPKDFEIGVMVYQLVFQRSSGVELDPSKPEDNPDFLINAQKVIHLQRWLELGIGTRSGVNAVRERRDLRFVSFSYIVSQWDITEDHKLVAGTYYANDAYAAYGTNFGVLAGFDLSIVKQKLNVVGDVTSGTNSMSVVNTGFEFFLPKEWSITLAAQFPLPGSGNDRGAVIQITKR